MAAILGARAASRPGPRAAGAGRTAPGEPMRRPSPTPAPVPGPRRRSTGSGGWLYFAALARSGWCRRCGAWSPVALGLAGPPGRPRARSRRCRSSSTAAPTGARTVLSSIAGAMISVTGLVFSITIVVLQLASSQFSPRLLRTFLESRVTQHTLGVFAASFLYALTVLRSIVDTPESSRPAGRGDPAYLLVLGAVGDVPGVHPPHHPVDLGHQHHPPGGRRDPARWSAGARPSRAAPRRAPELPRLARPAHRGRRRVRLPRHDRPERPVRLAPGTTPGSSCSIPLGTFVVEGAPVALVHGGPATDVDWDADVDRGLGSAHDRSHAAGRVVRLPPAGRHRREGALPGDQRPHDRRPGHRRAARHPAPDGGRARPLPGPARRRGVVRLVTQDWTFAQYLDLALDEIAHYGADSLQVPRRLDSMLLDLEAAATPAHRPTVAAKAAELRHRRRGLAWGSGGRPLGAGPRDDGAGVGGRRAPSAPRRTHGLGVADVLAAVLRAGSRLATPAGISTSRESSPCTSRRRNDDIVSITLSGCPCAVVRSPGASRYSSTRTRSFSNTTW